MKVLVLAAALLIGPAVLAAQIGAVQRLSLSEETVRTGTAVKMTVTGKNPCGAVQIDPGDGTTPVTHPITNVPTTISYTYMRPGTYQARARGMGNCEGTATAQIRVTGPALAPPPQAEKPAEPAKPEPRMRFAELDRNDDGVIARSEWQGSSRDFREADWNGDGVLSGDEVKPGARRPAQASRSDSQERERPRQSGQIDRFDQFDRNNDGRITRAEWPFSDALFDQADRDGNGVLSREEVLESAPAPAEPPGTGGQVVTVDGTQQWNDTGIYVNTGDSIQITTAGTIRLSPDEGDVAEASGSRSGRRAANAPFPTRNAGALIARIGDSPPLFIGDTANILRAPATGVLYLGVNDDHFADNSGELRVRVNVQRRRR